MLRVVVHEKGGRTQRFNFDGDLFSVGREEDNDLVLDRVNISKHHLRLRRHDGAVEVVDLGSTNGTYINGRRVGAPRAIRRADRVYVGDYILMVEGDDPAIAAHEVAEVMVAGSDGRPARRRISVAPIEPARLDLEEPHVGVEPDEDVLTSARRVPPAGLESSYLDALANRVLQTVLGNVHRLNPLKAAEIGESDRLEALTLVDGLIADLDRNGELQDGVAVESLKAQVARELLQLGPLTELMEDPDVCEIQVVGSGPIRVVRTMDDARTITEVTHRRFSGDRALVLTIQRLARKWKFLVEGSLTLEGKVDHGFSMYAVLQPSHLGAPVLSLRRNPTDANTLDALVREGVLSDEMTILLQAAVRGCRRILITASGATNLDRFMGAIAGEIPDHLRVVCISDSGRLGRAKAGWVQVRRISDPSDGLGLSDVLGVVLRGGVDLLVSQRCRHEDAAAVMDAFSGAARGTIVSLWGIDSAHGLWRLAGLSTVAAGAIAALTVSLARSVDLLVRLSSGVSGEPMQVVELIEPRVRDGDRIEHVPIFAARRNEDGCTVFEATGEVPHFIDDVREQGVTVDQRIFESPASASHGQD